MEKLVMNIKRILFALIAMMLLPALANADIVLPPITPAEGTAVIAVVVEFADNNDEDEVLVSLTCPGGGTISPTSATLGNDEGAQFVVDNIPGDATDCVVTQSTLGDYDARYLCAPGETIEDFPVDDEDFIVPPNTIGGDVQCLNPFVLSTTSCSWGDDDDVSAGEVGYCIISPIPDTVDVDVTKVWETFGAEQADFDPDVLITLDCPTALDVCAATDKTCGVGSTTQTAYIWLRDSNGDFDDKDGDYIGEGTAEFHVIPDFYDTAADPDDQLFTECTATENIKDSSVDTVNGCNNIEVAAGVGDECTITNTVFFEGIPTLSQYGMAIMALLMLGVGFIGVRRFV
jgi:hypothetical protein